MAFSRLLGVLLGACLACALLLVPGLARAANPFPTQGEAQVWCEQGAAERGTYQGVPYTCVLTLGDEYNVDGHLCESHLARGAYNIMLGSSPQLGAPWCVAAQCVAGSLPYGPSDGVVSGFDQSGTHGDGNGCCVSFVLAYSGKSAGDPDSAGYSMGHWVRTGDRCTNGYGATSGSIPVAPKLVPYKACAGKASCWDPFLDKFCGTTESGESVCEPRQNPPPGGCISGATGSVCVGKDSQPSPPPDPPVPPNTPPGNTTNYTINGGNTTNNYTVNQYSGTSPGPGTSSPTSSGSPGGTGSNTDGSGNSGTKGTDPNGHCPDGKVPTASGCSGTYRDDGCDTPPACFGDAVLCGIAANTHKSACATAPASGSSAGVPDEGDPLDGSGDPQGSAVSSAVDLGAVDDKLDAGGFGYSQSCPLNDWHFSVLGKSVDVAMADKCDLLAWIRYVVLAMGYFIAAKIIAGVK